MIRSSLLSNPPAVFGQTLSVRPAPAEQSVDRLELMVADLLARSQGILTDWAERLPLDDGESSRQRARQSAAQDRLGRLLRSYVGQHGRLDVPLLSLGSDYRTLRGALRSVVADIARSDRLCEPDKPDSHKG